jgi:antitoxin PrlF
MQAKAKLTSKGQVTIPKAVRQRLGIKTGDEVLFVEDRAGIHLRRNLPDSAFAKWVGYLGNCDNRASDDLVREMRGD